MAILAELHGKVKFDPGTARGQIIADVHVVDDPAQLLLDVDILTELSGQFHPVVGDVPVDDDGHFAGPLQSLTHSFSFNESSPGASDGLTLLPDSMTEWECERTLEDGASWSLGVPGI